MEPIELPGKPSWEIEQIFIPGLARIE